MEKKKIALGCIVGIVLIALIVFVTSDKNTSAATGTQVQINYTGSWSGAYTDGSGTQSIDGTGPKTVNVSTDSIYTSVDAQKKDGSNKELTISIIKDGKTVATKNTTAEYGVVTVAD